ncbi:MAG: hypothetical protein WBD99_12820 [Thermodesulfobacteriota bacterium]
MSRPLRIEFPDTIYHVMNRGIARRKIFTETEGYRGFLNRTAESHELRGFEVFDTCDRVGVKMDIDKRFRKKVERL